MLYRSANQPIAYEQVLTFRKQQAMLMSRSAMKIPLRFRSAVLSAGDILFDSLDPSRESDFRCLCHANLVPAQTMIKMLASKTMTSAVHEIR